ncbi:MAG: Ig-like domain-containing protein, partial [Gemmatimonadota bacterium]|nr:Ig-like domain-containing protein [Gemmatimonadota bacterium]
MRSNRRRARVAAAVVMLAGVACQTNRLTDGSGDQLWTSVSPGTALLNAIGATLQLGVVNAQGSPVTVPGLSWRTIESNIVQLDGSGRVTAIAPGTVRVIAETAEHADTATVEVRQTVSVITVSPSPITVQVATTQQMSAALRDPNGHDIVGRPVTWSSSATNVATVTGTGLVTGVAVGGATITASSEGTSGTASATVTAGPPPPPPPPVASVSVTPSAPSVVAGSTVQLTATLRDAGGNVLTGRPITWTTSANGVAIVSSSGLVTAVSPGSATITATSEGVSGTSSITVTAAPVATVTVAPSSAAVAVGSTVQLGATLRDANGNVLTGRTVTWSSNNTGVATVNGSGVVSGVSQGSATITATSEGKSGTSSITVTVSSGATCPQLPSPPPGYCTGAVHVVTPGNASIPTLGPGDVVVFEDGTYTDTNGDGTVVMIQQGGTASQYVTFVARNTWGARIDGQNNTTRYGFNFATVSYVRIEGFDIFGFGSTYAGTVAAPSASGVMIQAGGAFSQIVGNHIHHISNFCNETIRAQTAIFIQRGNVLVEANVIHDVG